jgi:ABC-type transport system substrate-binding protein
MKKFTRSQFSKVSLAGVLGITLAAMSIISGQSASGVTPVIGGTLRIAFQSDPTTFDPQVCYDATCWDNMEMIFNRLYDYEPGNTKLVPQAAVTLPKISADGLTYKINLRPGMKFSNGSPLTASDVAYTFSRICDPATKSPVVSFWTVVKGCDAFAKNPIGTVSGITVASPTQLSVALTRPNSAFVYVMAMPHASIVPIGTGKQQATNPLGSGPFKFVSFTPGSSIVLAKNTDYWNPGRPYLAGVHEALGVSPEIQLLQLQKGELDVMGDKLPNSSYLNVINDKSLANRISHRIGLSTYFLTLNLQVKPFNNPMVREAVSYAINRDFLLKSVNGQGTPATGFIPPGVTGYTKTNMVNGLNVAKAKSLLSKAGYPKGFSTDLYSWNTQPWTNLDAVLQQQLGTIGIKVKIHAVQMSTFFSLAGTPKKTPMTLTFWIADYPDGSDFFQALLSCGAAIPGGQNYPFYCNKKFDSLVNQGLSNPAKVQALYEQAAKIMQVDNPVIPLYYGKNTTVYGPKVGGFVENPIWGYMVSNYWLKN